MNRYRWPLWGLCLLALSSQATFAQQANLKQIQAHIQFLADDLLEGRETGSTGHEIASRYIASEFKKYGLQPAGDKDNGETSYLQRVTFRQALLQQDSPELIFYSDNEQITLEYPKHYLPGANIYYENALVDGEMVFAGYGIVAPELDHDDYQGLDVAGKVVVVLAGKPASFPSEEGAHFGSGYEKRRHAVARGAKGIIAISTPTREKVSPYVNLLNYIHSPKMQWLTKQGLPANEFAQLKNSAYLSKEAADILFRDAPMSLAQIYAQLEQEQTPKGFALPLNVRLSTNSKHTTISSPNVVAILPGSDEALKREYVVYSAHSDHIGLAKTVKKDKINNGAMDNASGTAVMLETARMFSQHTEAPKRSILFIAVTAEERGLLGSDYFAQNPTVPLAQLVANVNLDMPILTYEFADVVAFGANHSDLEASVEKATNKIGIKLSPDPMPEQALFTRSDHYSFVKQGIPAVFLMSGFNAAKDGVSGEQEFRKFLTTHYHKPTDDLSQPFDWRAATKFTEVNYQIGLSIANQTNRPQWHLNDFFGDTFSKN